MDQQHGTEPMNGYGNLLTPSLLLTGLLLLVSNQSAFAQQDGIADQMREDASGLTAFAANSATVRRKPDERCMGFEPFKFVACGPMMSISLTLMPGMYGSTEYATTQGGDMAQILNALAGMGEATSGNTLNDLARQADSVDGSSIIMSIPLIDYGFTGTFNNASISMNRANSAEQSGFYQAIGPRDAIPGPGSEFPLSGSVTIEEYSPVVLRGKFSGAMVDPSRADMSGNDPVLPVLIELSGSFSVVAPWRGDNRAVIRSAEEMESAVRQDIEQVFDQARTEVAADAMDKISAGTVIESSRVSSSGPGCDCSCNLAGSAASVCQQSCAGTFEACKGIPVPGLIDKQLQAAENLALRAGDAESQLREDFIAMLTRQSGHLENFDEALESLLDTFDSMTNLNDKATLYTAQGGEKLCPPPKELEEALMMYSFAFCM